MKRSKPLRTRKPLRSGKPLRRKTRLRARSETNSYRKRPRDLEYMLFVKRLPCILRRFPPAAVVQELARGLDAVGAWTPCSGAVEADHLGERGMGQKADDRTCAPLCRKHHRERHDHAGSFRPLTKDELRAWRAHAIEHTQTEWSNR